MAASAIPLQANDELLLQEMRRRNGATVKELLQATGVTRTALRQRLTRLMQQGLVQRREVRQARGRPAYVYATSERAERFFGSNYCDLAACLWEAICATEDPATRQELVRRVRDVMVQKYRERIGDGPLAKRLDGLRQMLVERGIDVEVDSSGDYFVLRQHDCPYADLAFSGESICGLEKQVLVELLECDVESRQRRVSEDSSYCEFEIRTQTGKADRQSRTQRRK